MMRKQSRRRMLVAQRRQRRHEDVLRRKRQLGDKGIEFWRYIVANVGDDVVWSDQGWDNAARSGSMTIQGPLPRKRRLAKPIMVDVVYEADYWLVSEASFSMHATGTTISKAIDAFREVITDEAKQ